MKKLFLLLLFVFCTRSFAGIAFVQKNNNRCASATTCTVALTSVGSNDFIVFYAVSNAGSQTVSSGPTDSNGTVSAARAYSQSGGAGAGVYYVPTTATGTHTFSITFGVSSNIELYAMEFSGGATAPFDSASLMGAATSGVNATTASITPAENNALVMGFANAANSGITFSAWSSGLVQQDTISTGPSTSWSSVIQTTAAAAVSNYTLSTSASWTSIVVAFKPLVAAPFVTGFVISNGHVLISNGKPVVVN